MTANRWYRVEATGRDGQSIRYNDTHSERERDAQLATAREHHREPIGYLAVTQHDTWGPQQSMWIAASAERTTDREAER